MIIPTFTVPIFYDQYIETIITTLRFLKRTKSGPRSLSVEIMNPTSAHTLHIRKYKRHHLNAPHNALLYVIAHWSNGSVRWHLPDEYIGVGLEHVKRLCNTQTRGHR